MTKNTDPKALDRSNVGDCAVIVLQNGNTQSAKLTHLSEAGGTARFEWRTGPGRNDWRFTWIVRSQWLDRVTLFPPGAKFLVVEAPPGTPPNREETVDRLRVAPGVVDQYLK